MRLFEAYVQSLTPYAQGRYHDTPRLPRELHDDYELRTYLAKLHTALGKIYIPPMAFKNCLVDTASYLKMPIPGRGKETYTKNIRQGLLCNEPLLLDLTPEQTRLERVFTQSQPGRASGGRVWKYFPVIDRWEGTLSLVAIDDIVDYDVVYKHLDIGGAITGIGVWRPQRNGLWGKFKLVTLTEKPLDL